MAQEVGTPRRRERAALASPKRSPRWPCLGGETDGVVPLKAQYQPTTRPTPPSTRPPTLTHMLNYSCAPQNPTKDLLRCRYAGWWWHLVWRLHNYWQGFFPPFMQMWVFWDGLVARNQDVRRHKQLQLNMSLCMKMLRHCKRCCNFMLAFDLIYYAVVHTLFQEMYEPWSTHPASSEWIEFFCYHCSGQQSR